MDYHHYRNWLKELNPKPIDKDQLRNDIITQLRFYNKLDSRQYNLRKKWETFHQKPYKTKEINEIKKTIYQENKIPDPELIQCKTTKQKKIWTLLSRYIPSFLIINIPGRSIRYLIQDQNTNKILGFIRVSSELITHNHFLRLTKTQRLKNKQKIINCSVIVPVQPFGFNMLGGKLCALLSISDQIYNEWYEKYKVKPILSTTTSLYGSFSQYSGLKHWNSIHSISSQIQYRLPKELELRLIDWSSYYNPRFLYDYYFKPNNNIKNKFLSHCYNTLRIPKELKNLKYERGRYISSPYKNFNLYLRNRISKEQLIDKKTNQTTQLIEIWKYKAQKRLDKLKGKNRLKTDSYFLDVLHNNNWEQVKNL